MFWNATEAASGPKLKFKLTAGGTAGTALIKASGGVVGLAGDTTRPEEVPTAAEVVGGCSGARGGKSVEVEEGEEEEVEGLLAVLEAVEPLVVHALHFCGKPLLKAAKLAGYLMR